MAGSSMKSMTGHPQGACGAEGIAATLLAMRDGVVSPTINLDTPDPECDLDYIPNEGRKLVIEHAMCNCIAFGSKNSAIVLRRGLRTFAGGGEVVEGPPALGGGSRPNK